METQYMKLNRIGKDYPDTNRSIEVSFNYGKDESKLTIIVAGKVDLVCANGVIQQKYTKDNRTILVLSDVKEFTEDSELIVEVDTFNIEVVNIKINRNTILEYNAKGNTYIERFSNEKSM